MGKRSGTDSGEQKQERDTQGGEGGGGGEEVG